MFSFVYMFKVGATPQICVLPDVSSERGAGCGALEKNFSFKGPKSAGSRYPALSLRVARRYSVHSATGMCGLMSSDQRVSLEPGLDSVWGQRHTQDNLVVGYTSVEVGGEACSSKG